MKLIQDDTVQNREEDQDTYDRNFRNNIKEQWYNLQH